MKKNWICLCLLAALFSGVLGCGTGVEPAQTTAPTQAAAVTQPIPEETVPETTETVPTVPETVPELPDEYLFLTVSRLDMSVVGEQEDIYIGSVPRDQVTWESGDEAVVTVENGVLTATGVGETTITGSWGDQQVSCVFSCLAPDQETLMTLDNDVLRSPKRMPFAVDQWPQEFFSDAAFVGDSITYTLWHTAGKDPLQLGNALFLVRGGTSINGFVGNYKNIYLRGQEMHLDDAIAASGVQKVFFMLGQNDLSYMTIEDTMANWTRLLDRVKAQSPDVEIYIQSLVPEWFESYADNAKNDKIDTYNQLLKTYCDENGYHFIEIAAYIEDHTNRMATVYSMDRSIHINYDGTDVWMKALMTYARLQQLQGE